MICTGVGSECPEWTERHVLCRHQHESVDSFGICTLLCILCWHQQVCADSRPQPKSKPKPKSQQQQKHGWPSFLRSSADQVFAALVGQSSPAKPAVIGGTASCSMPVPSTNMSVSSLGLFCQR